MRNLLWSFVAVLFLVSPRAIGSEKKEGPPGPIDEKVISLFGHTDRDKTRSLLTEWWKEGTAAGNLGDYYENRDQGHSRFDRKKFPQFSEVTHTAEEHAKGLTCLGTWGLQTKVLPKVVIGNSSTALHAQGGGSNARQCYGHQAGMDLLYKQYTHNNMYFYISHKDHNVWKPIKVPYNIKMRVPPPYLALPVGEAAKRYSVRGWGRGNGDLYPTNTPYVVNCWGSSYTERSLMSAVALAFAAFRPEVKKKLVETNLLMPTVQMLLRMAYGTEGDAKDYLKGKAHPTVFSGQTIQGREARMVEMAHAIKLDDIPPMIQLKVVEEDEAVNGRDFFEPEGRTEKIADTPGCIARVFLSKARERRIVLSAEGSYDVNKRPLTYHWAVLRGDPKKVSIKPLNASGSRVEVRVGHHTMRPVGDGTGILSTRVDIGAFVHNGAWYSAPGFLTYFCPPDEARTYGEDGRLLEIAYGTGGPIFHAVDWGKFAGHLKKDPNGLGAALLKEWLKTKGDPNGIGGMYDASLTKAVDFAAIVNSKGPSTVRTYFSTIEHEVVTTALRLVAADPLFVVKHQAKIEALLKAAPAEGKAAHAKARERLVKMGLLKKGAASAFELTPLRGGGKPLAERLTPGEKDEMRRFNAAVLAALVYRGIDLNYCPYYVDSVLSAPKSWRDVYKYGPDGKCTGWTRCDGERVTEFRPDGSLAGGGKVAYKQNTAPPKPVCRPMGVHGEWLPQRNPNPLLMVPQR